MSSILEQPHVEPLSAPTIRSLRLSRGLAISDIAVRTGIPIRILVEIEYGMRPLTEEWCARLSEFFDVRTEGVRGQGSGVRRRESGGGSQGLGGRDQGAGVGGQQAAGSRQQTAGSGQEMGVGGWGSGVRSNAAPHSSLAAATSISDSIPHNISQPQPAAAAPQPQPAAAVPQPQPVTQTKRMSGTTLWPADIGLRLFLMAFGFVPIGCLALALFGFVPLSLSTPYFILPMTALAIAVCVAAPSLGRQSLWGLVAGMVATVAYDAYRFTCISNGWWTDFIPVIGQLVFDDPSASPFWGYLYRYLGDGGAMGITFALLPWRTKRIGIAFAIAIYFCLMGTLMLAPGAQEALFPLTPLTAALAMGGHLIYGSVLEWGIQRWGSPSSGVIAPPLPGLNGAQATLPTARTDPRPRVVIVGAGFGGLSAAHTLGNRDVDVLVLSRTNYHGFWPMLYQVATAEVQPEAIAYPVRGVLRRYHNADFRLAEVTGVDLQRKLVLTDGASVAYDHLILAAGSTTNYFGNDQLREQTLPMRDLDEAQRLRDHMLLQVEQAAQEPDPAKRAALLTFVVVGGGPTGVELAGALADLIRQTLRKDYPSLDVSQARVMLVEASDCILKTFPAELRAEARQRLEKMGVEVRVNTGVRQAAGNIVTFQNDATLPAHTVVWAAGVRAAALTDALNVTLGQGARVKVAPTLNLPDHPNVFVIGDMAFLESPGGAAYPMLAQVAIQMGKQAANNVLAQVRGRAQKPFRYFDVGQMAIIGPGAAICNSFGLRLRGGSAWLLWLSVHLANLCGRRNRLLTLIHWLSTGVTTDRGARVVTRVER